MTDHISPDRMDAAAERAAIAIGTHEGRDSDWNDVVVARIMITAALPDLLADRDAERDAPAQAIHDARGILGFDNDGDTKPHTSDYHQYADFHRADAAEQRRDYDVVCAENEALRDQAQAQGAVVATLSNLRDAERARADAQAGQLAAVAALAEDLLNRAAKAADDGWRETVLLETSVRLRAVLDDPDGELRAVKAEAWDEGYDSGLGDGWADGAGRPEINPYRAASHDGSPT